MQTHSGTDPKLTALIVAAIDYGCCLGRLSADLEPTDVVQSEIALDKARERMLAAREALHESDVVSAAS